MRENRISSIQFISIRDWLEQGSLLKRCFESKEKVSPFLISSVTKEEGIYRFYNSSEFATVKIPNKKAHSLWT